MKVISVSSMRELDARTIRNGTPGDVLMERAGAGACRTMMNFLERKLLPHHRQRFSVLAGKGNNGGDAYVVARCLKNVFAVPTEIYATAPVETLKGDARHHAEIAVQDVSVHVVETLPPEALTPGTVLVDGLLGTGMSGALRKPYDTLIGQINRSMLPVVSLDIPSGMNGDDGTAETDAVTADLTLTMALPKTGLLSEAGRSRCGVLRTIDIGISPDDVASVTATGEAIVAEDIAPLLSRRPQEGHKGTFGHCLILGGSKLYGGAPCLAATAALRTGTGLATLAVPEGVAPTPGNLPMALIRRTIDSSDGFWDERCLSDVVALVDGKQSVVFGPGVGRNGTPEIVLECILGVGIPTVVDADGLLAFPAMVRKKRVKGDVVLTPHPGEMRSLISGLGLSSILAGKSRPEQTAAVAAHCGVYIILKGCGTVVASPTGATAVNTTGTAALGTGGSGDVLAGMIGGLLAQGFTAWDACRSAVFLHGLADEVSTLSSRALIADDLIEGISNAFREITAFA